MELKPYSRYDRPNYRPRGKVDALKYAFHKGEKAVGHAADLVADVTAEASYRGLGLVAGAVLLIGAKNVAEPIFNIQDHYTSTETVRARLHATPGEMLTNLGADLLDLAEVGGRTTAAAFLGLAGASLLKEITWTGIPQTTSTPQTPIQIITPQVLNL